MNNKNNNMNKNNNNMNKKIDNLYLRLSTLFSNTILYFCALNGLSFIRLNKNKNKLRKNKLFKKLIK